MTNNEDKIHALHAEHAMHTRNDSQDTIMDESDQHHNARLSRADFFKVVTATALGAAGTLMYTAQPTLAAASDKQAGGAAQGNKTRSGLYYIQSLLTGFVLDIPNSNHAAGTLVSVFPRNTPFSYNQLWFVSEDGYIQNLLNGFVLDVVGAHTIARTLVDVVPRNHPPSPNQHWFFSDGYIYTALDGMVLDISESNPAPGAKVIVFPKDSPRSNNQQWALVRAF